MKEELSEAGKRAHLEYCRALHQKSRLREAAALLAYKEAAKDLFGEHHPYVQYMNVSSVIIDPPTETNKA
jgi:hypothetical protein